MKKSPLGMTPLFIAVGALGIGCLFAQPKPYTTALVVPSLQVHDQAEITQDNITISITPILPDNEQNYPDIYKRVAWTATRKTAAGSTENYQAQGESAIIPEPAFKISIANHTGHVVRFTQTVFRLQDDKGKSYQPYTGTAEITAWLENVWSSTVGPQVAAEVMSQLTASVNALSLLDRNRELLNGDEWSGYLVFNLGINAGGDYDRFMNSISRLTLRMAEVPVELSEAGEVTRTTEFTFHLDRTTTNFTVTCPGSVKTPDLVNCEKVDQ